MDERRKEPRVVYKGANKRERRGGVQSAEYAPYNKGLKREIKSMYSGNPIFQIVSKTKRNQNDNGLRHASLIPGRRVAYTHTLSEHSHTIAIINNMAIACSVDAEIVLA